MYQAYLNPTEYYLRLWMKYKAQLPTQVQLSPGAGMQDQSATTRPGELPTTLNDDDRIFTYTYVTRPKCIHTYPPDGSNIKEIT